jgi:hypothetical protein
VAIQFRFVCFVSTEFGVDESALFVRLRGVFNSTLITLSVKCNFPNSVVGICTILPRKGKGPNITKCNDSFKCQHIFNTLDLASFIVSSIFSNVAPEIEAFMQFGETFPSLLQLEAPGKTFKKTQNIG